MSTDNHASTAITSRPRDRAIGMLIATGIIAAAWATVEGLGTGANPGILVGPVGYALAVLVPGRKSGSEVQS